MTYEEWNESTKNQVFDGCEINDPRCYTCRSKAKDKIINRNWNLVNKKIARQQWFRPFQVATMSYPDEKWSNLTKKDITLEWNSTGGLGETIMFVLTTIGVIIGGVVALIVGGVLIGVLEAIFNTIASLF